MRLNRIRRPYRVSPPKTWGPISRPSIPKPSRTPTFYPIRTISYKKGYAKKTSSPVKKYYVSPTEKKFLGMTSSWAAKRLGRMAKNLKNPFSKPSPLRRIPSDKPLRFLPEREVRRQTPFKQITPRDPLSRNPGSSGSSSISTEMPKRYPNRPQNPKSFGGSNSLHTSYSVPSGDIYIKTHGKGKLMSGRDFNRARRITNTGFNLNGGVYGKFTYNFANNLLNRTPLNLLIAEVCPADATDRYQVQVAGTTSRFLIHNFDRVMTYVDFYVLTPKFDSSTSVSTALDQSAQLGTYTSFGGTSSKEDLDFTIPNALFAKQWTVLSKRSFSIGPGGNVKIVHDQDGFYPFYENRMTGAGEHLKGISTHYLFRAHCGPVREAATPGTVTTGTPDLAITQTLVVNFLGRQNRQFSRQEVNELSPTLTLQNVKMPGSQGIASGDGIGVNGSNVDGTADDMDAPT